MRTTTKKALILRAIKNSPEGISVWRLAQFARTNDVRKRVSELRQEGIRIATENVRLPDGTLCARYRLLNPNQKEVGEMLARYGA